MGQKLVVGPLINKGLKTDREPFAIDNDSFPTLINAYQWRGRVKRKRGTTTLGRLNRFIGTTDGSGNITVTIKPHPITSGISYFVIGTDVFTDPGGASPVTLVTNSSGSATLNRTTGVLTVMGSQATTSVYYYPGLPVMGLRSFETQPDTNINPPQTIAFDTTYSYEISSTVVSNAYPIYDVSYYKNPPDSTYASYTAKTTWTPLNWSGGNYQQFWTTNFSGAMFATNGKPGMQYENKGAVTATYVSTTEITFGISGGTPAVVGDFIFVNEWTATGSGVPNTLNFQTGYVISGSGGPPFTSITVKFPNASITDPGMGFSYSGGMIQYLTTTKTNTVDGIRWYDGDPTGGGTYPPSTNLGWVNYAPPLSQSTFSINSTPSAQYYLCGATMIYPFRDFLLFVGPYIQTSASSASTTTPIWLQDTVIYMANGTPYYTASFDNSSAPFAFNKIYNPILTPANEGAYPMVGWEDVTGYGGYIASGVAQPITTLVPNEDVLILGYPKAFTRVIYTGNNLIPFLFYRINTELGASSTFSAITFDKGSFTLGNFGICLTTQVAAQRVDLEIPDQAFEVNYLNNGVQRVCSGRDYINEWVYITYPSNSVSWVFPNQTLMYNYRDNSWAIHNECYTSYGQFYPETGDTWGSAIWAWGGYDVTWNSSIASVGNPELIGGNQQGFVLIRDTGTNEGQSLFVSNINTSNGHVTSTNHCLNQTDPDSGASNYVVFANVNGPVTSNGSNINGLIFQVLDVIDANTFTTYPPINGGTYKGGGTMARAYVPFIQTKQFPLEWAIARKTILGPQMYLITRTAKGQITLNIYLSTDPDYAYNDPSQNDGIEYSQVLYTCPESTNLGLTPANINLQQINRVDSSGNTTNNQAQIWHRMNTSLIGDTVQVGFTMSNDQMLDPNFNNQFAEIEIHGFILDVAPGGYLA